MVEQEIEKEELNKRYGLQQENINSFMVSMNEQVKNVLALVQRINERVSVVEARSKANGKWCLELQKKQDEQKGTEENNKRWRE